MILVGAFHHALILDMRLTEQTKHFVELDWSVRVSESDAADRNFSVEALNRLRQAGAKP